MYVETERETLTLRGPPTSTYTTSGKRFSPLLISRFPTWGGKQQHPRRQCLEQEPRGRSRTTEQACLWVCQVCQSRPVV
ncbi:unnamed protein product [Gadus morhua 'NCC']